MNSSMTSKSCAGLPSSSTTTFSRPRSATTSDGSGSYGLRMATSPSSGLVTENPSRFTGFASRTRIRPKSRSFSRTGGTALLLADFGFVVDDPADQLEATRITVLEVERKAPAEDEQPDDDPRRQLEQKRSCRRARRRLFVLPQQQHDIQHPD